MLPGPDEIVACPHCQGLAKFMTLMSGNTFGVRVWTDGKQVAPMLPRPPAVVWCRHCAKAYWLADAREVGRLDRWGQEGLPADPAWSNVEDVEEPTEVEYYTAIDAKLARDRAQLRSLRILAWWRANDAFRDRSSVGVGTGGASSVAYRRNLESLAELLDEENENDLVMKAEAMRELGEFKAAVAVLSRIESREYADVVRQLRSLCDHEDAGVRELRFDASP